MGKLLLLHFRVTNVKLIKKSHKYYSLNICEPLEIDTMPYASKNLLQEYVLGFSRHTQK